MIDLNNPRIGVIGLGYVGLPLAAAFGQQFPTLGFDIKAERVAELQAGRDSTLEVAAAELGQARLLRFSHRGEDLAECNIYIISVPTPIDAARRPDLSPLELASRLVASYLRPNDLVIYESTVYPGCTEEFCVPLLEQGSGLVFNRDFFCGYSPERVNPGDKTHRLSNIRKVTSGSTPEVAEVVDALYRRVIEAGTHRAPSMRVAEAAKVIENTQRDVNIALINELALIFHKLEIDTEAVLQAAGTKWNFLPFRPGLVGGHCIGVDPYYLTHKAQMIGYHPAMILAGRRINDGMGQHVASRVIKLLIKRQRPVAEARILVLGLAFKENCPDLRNTRVVDIINELGDYGAQVEVHDPWVNATEAEAEYGLRLVDQPQPGSYDAMIIAVAHDQFHSLGEAGIRALGRPGAILFDVKYLLPAEASDGRL
ncbi:MAG: nucleotide sugar dehydrogenase [Gammaproteobacteria bacterium SHHR-1]|uniref:nucleotide sugar dehydrogenase n=1 Tax=Magnetovirga frankeli TaxID=947516 RepID=UPI001293716A|nr:nucleotide sugar dehydrogenase [gamma proteobacterium SS-5]